MRDTEGERGEREREKQAPCREPDMGLDPETSEIKVYKKMVKLPDATEFSFLHSTISKTYIYFCFQLIESGLKAAHPSGCPCR